MEAHESLMNCQSEVEILIRNHMKEIAKKFRELHILSKDEYKSATSTQSRETPGDKAHELFMKLTDFVEEDEDYYNKFMDYLREDDKYKKTISLLDAEYKRLKGGECPKNECADYTELAEQSLQHESRNEDTKILHRESVNPMKQSKMDSLMFSESVDEKRKLELEIQSYDMQLEFTDILTELKKFIVASSRTTVDEICWILEINPRKAMRHRVSSISDIQGEVPQADIIKVISTFSSFFNYEIVEKIINTVNFEKGMSMMSSYKEKFMEYAKNRVIECPTCLKRSESNDCSCFIFLDDCFKNYEQIYLKILKRDISRILKKDITYFFLQGVFSGSFIVIFHLAMIHVNEVFPLSDEQLYSLKMLRYNEARICQLICGFYDYKINAEKEGVPAECHPLPSVDFEDVEDMFSSFTDKLSDFEKETTAALTQLEVLHGTNMHYYASQGDLSAIKYSIKKGYYDPERDNEHGNTALHCAVLSGHLLLAKYFIEELNLSPMTENAQNRTLIHLAAISNNFDIMNYLINNNEFDLYEKDCYKAVALHYSCGLGNCQISQILINRMTKNFSVKEMLNLTCINRDNSTFNPFHIAIGLGHIKIIEYFISSLHHNCSDDIMALLLSTLHSHILQFLLNSQNYTLVDKHLALFMAVNKGCVDSMNHMMIVHHCKLPPRVSKNDLRLHFAAIRGDLMSVKSIIANNLCSIKSFSVCKRTILHHACINEHLQIVKYLIEENHYDIMLDKINASPVHLAAAMGYVDIIIYFSSRNIEVLPKDKNNETPLHYAAADGKLNVVKYYLEIKEVDPNLEGFLKRTILHHACNHGHFDIVQYLIEKYDSDALCQDEEEGTPLHLASHKGHLNIVQYLTREWAYIPLLNDKYGINPVQAAVASDEIKVLQYYLEKGCSSKMLNVKKRTLLHISSICGSIKITKFLIRDLNFDPLSSDENGSTPLHFASCYGHIKLVKYLCEFIKESEEIKNKAAYTPLYLAVINNKVEVTNYLIKNNKYDPDYREPGGMNYLHLLSLHGNVSNVKLLIETQLLSPHGKDEEGLTPLMLACFKGHFQLVKYFVEECQCSVFTKDKLGNMTLHYAAQCSLKITKYLIEEMKLDCNSKGDFELSPLHFSTIFGQLDIVKYLVLKCKCDLNVRAKDGFTPLHFAAYHGHIDVVIFLLSQNCEPLVRDIHSNTPFHYAARQGNLDIVKLYVEQLHCPPNIPGKSNITALAIAHNFKHDRVVKYLQQQHNLANILVTTASAPQHFEKDLAMQQLLSGIFQIRSIYPQQASSEKLAEGARRNWRHQNYLDLPSICRITGQL